jgi:tellurite resistance protein TerB
MSILAKLGLGSPAPETDPGLIASIEIASEEEKLRLIDCLYAVATADDLITYVEDREVRRIADALLIAPSQLQSVRAPYREKLEELQLLRRARARPP